MYNLLPEHRIKNNIGEMVTYLATITNVEYNKDSNGIEVETTRLNNGQIAVRQLDSEAAIPYVDDLVLQLYHVDPEKTEWFKGIVVL